MLTGRGAENGMLLPVLRNLCQLSLPDVANFSQNMNVTDHQTLI